MSAIWISGEWPILAVGVFVGAEGGGGGSVELHFLHDGFRCGLNVSWAAWRTLVYAAWVDAVAMGRAGVRRGGVLCRLRGAFVGDGAFSGWRAMAFVGGREACRCRPALACLQKIAIFLRRNASVRPANDAVCT